MRAPPIELLEFQKWMASLFHQTPTSEATLQKEIARHISPQTNCNLLSRIKIYQQNVSNRHIRHMQRNLPQLCRHLKEERFTQEIAIPYLKKHTSRHWSLDELFLHSNLAEWIRKNYAGEDKQKALELLELDLATKRASLAARTPSPDLSGSPLFFSTRFSLQPHVQLLQTAGVVSERHGGYNTQKRSHYLIFRNRHRKIVCEEIEAPQFFILKKLEGGSSFEESQEELLRQFGDIDLSAMCSWFFLCDQRGLFVAR